jgi:hypothetical protein
MKTEDTTDRHAVLLHREGYETEGMYFCRNVEAARTLAAKMVASPTFMQKRDVSPTEKWVHCPGDKDGEWQRTLEGDDEAWGRLLIYEVTCLAGTEDVDNAPFNTQRLYV